MEIGFHGAARTVTGSKALLKLQNGTNILVDCGLFQGMGPQTDELNEDFGFAAAEVNVLLLTHAHIDHSGLIPKLVKEGFKGKIFSTEATRDLSEILLYDSAEIQTYETEHINRKRKASKRPLYEPLYTAEDVAATLTLFEVVEYDCDVEIATGVTARFINTGHLAGSAAIFLSVKENGKTTTLHFTGDVGRYNSVLLQSPQEFPQADYIISESTYGDKRHDISFSTVKHIRQWLEKTCVEKQGKLIIPAFSVGRTQEVLYALNQLEVERRLPELKYFVDSPLSQKATGVLKKYTAHFNERLQQVMQMDNDPFHFEGLKYVESVEDSRRLVSYEEPCVIISASGTADAGRVRHHIQSCVGDSKNSILFVGYCSEKSLGGELLSGSKEIELFGNEHKVRAEIGRMDGMSAHADCDELGKYLTCGDASKVKTIFLVHGEYGVQQKFAARLETKEFKNVVIPAPHESFTLA
ncbi:MAG: MBL fold metallo-hydrolase RNA specificity domain-containing protein [Flavisolibacter sp.]